MEEESKIITERPKDIEFDIDLLRQYFRYLFPSTGMYNWLTYYQPDLTEDDQKVPFSDYFYKREFSFTLMGDIYCRYNCFRNEKEFKDTLIDQSPIKIDIGAVYNMPPKNHSSIDSKAFMPREKELVFDIDMTDYDDVRTCCEGANVCNKCWKFMSVAVKIIDTAIREDFGFNQLLWVFSGRRGVHCWVCDQKTRKLNNEARTAIANYLTVHVGNEMTSATALVEMPTYPALARAKEIIETDFTEIMMREQNILQDEKQRNRLMNMLPKGDAKDLLETNWESYMNYDDPENSVSLWKVFKQVIQKESDKSSRSKVDFVASAMFTFLYPRIDANVSKGINHLLKSPFCVHPKTGKICVPFDPTKVDEFDPCACPTLSQALNEYDELCQQNDAGSKAKPSTVPCLKESMLVFNSFLKNLKSEYTKTVIQNKRAQKSQVNHMEVESAF